MPCKEALPMEERTRFVIMAESERFELKALCKRFGISRVLKVVSQQFWFSLFRVGTRESRAPVGDEVAPLPGLKKRSGQTILPPFQPDASRFPPNASRRERCGFGAHTP